jgi:hypothetical protein
MSVDRRRLLRLSALGALSCIGPSWPSFAAGGKIIYEEQSFDTQVRVAGADLHLNGTGVRQVAWFKGYLAALYLASAASTAAQAVATRGPKRIQLRMLHGVPATEFSKAMRKGISRNVAPAELPGMTERIERFSRLIDAIGSVRKRDIVDLDFVPGRGLVMLMNGQVKGEPIPGEDFYGALLLSFVGNRPYDERMRAGLLGKPAE